MSNETNKSKKMYGWWSDKAYEYSKRYAGWLLCEIAVWLTPEQREVRVLNVTDSPTNSGTSWTDVVLVGEVSSFVRKERHNA